MEVAKPILDDDLWTLIEPLLPLPKRRRKRTGAKRDDQIATIVQTRAPDKARDYYAGVMF